MSEARCTQALGGGGGQAGPASATPIGAGRTARTAVQRISALPA
ncbi:hypothetical protein [Kitasatospora herbaricolor]